MNIKKLSIITAWLGIFIAFSSFGNEVWAQETGRRHYGPPAEAYTACEGKSAGETAALVSPYGDMVTDSCEQEGDRLVLRSDNPADGRAMDDDGDATGYAIVDTGQIACYDNHDELLACPAEAERFNGQDSQYEGCQFSYTDNGDGTVTDNVTGLMWQKSSDTDRDGGIDAGDKLTYDEAVARAATFNLGVTPTGGCRPSRSFIH